MWLLCSFQGPSEMGDNRPTHTRARRRAIGLSKLNSMHPLETDGMPVWRGQVRSTF